MRGGAMYAASVNVNVQFGDDTMVWCTPVHGLLRMRTVQHAPAPPTTKKAHPPAIRFRWTPTVRFG